MNERRQSINGVVWSYIATGLNLGAGIFLLPFLLHNLTTAEMAFWFIFNTLLAIPQIIETGYQSTIVRNFSYIHAGAQNMQKTGITQENNKYQKNISLESSLLEAAKNMNNYIAYGTGLFALLFSLYFIATNSANSEANTSSALVGWLLLSSGYIISVKYMYLNYVLQGQGNVVAAMRSLAIPRLIQLTLSAAFLYFGLGLVGIGLASVVANAVGRWMAWSYINKYTDINIKSKFQDEDEIRRVAKIISHNSLILIGVTAGAYLTQRFNILISTHYLSLDNIAAYGLSITIFSSASGIASSIAQARNPQFNFAHATNDKKELIGILGEAITVAFITYFIISFFIFMAGIPLIKEFFPNAKLIDRIPLLILMIFFGFELLNGIAGTYIAATNKIPFLLPVVLSGLGISILSILLLESTSLGVLALVASPLIVQSLYNNWKWISSAVSHLGCSYTELLSSGVARIRSYFI